MRKTLLRASTYVAASVLGLVTTIYFVRAVDSRAQLELGPEHRVRFDSEFRAHQGAGTDWQGYRAIEASLAIELRSKVDDHHRGDRLLDRHLSTSLTHPDNLEANWNYSYAASPASGRGAAVLLHGLTDSPYSMLATAGLFVGQGFHAVVPRMPGHGFAVGGLIQADWEDWVAAVRVAVRHAETLLEPGQPLVIAGYSNGALLALHLALECGENERCPDSLVLLSPAIGVSSFARLANLHHGISWLSFFDKFEWQNILPEVDPFKFTSFPKSAGWQIYQLSRRTHRLLAEPGRAERLPPILSFQSVVDNTVSVGAVVEILYDALPENGSELVIYDVNRNDTVAQLMSASVADPAQSLLAVAPLQFSVSVLSNQNSAGTKTEVARLEAGESDVVEEATELAWPPGVFSLSHIAVPFRSDDSLYGDGRQQRSGPNSGVRLGASAPRGERHVLALTPDYFLRLRYNPFYEYQASRIREWLEAL